MSELTDVNSTEAFKELRSIFYKYKKRSTPHVSSSSSWVSQLITENQIDEPVPFQIRKVLKTLAQRIHNDDVEAHKLIVSKQERYGNKDFHKALLTHGTTKDKIAAYMYKCMESPVYTVNELFSLIDFVNPNDKNCNKAISDISSVFETALLPNGHVARDFECHDFVALIPLIKTNFEQVEKQLVLWYFEGQVHLAYLKFLENIEKLCFDTQAKVKTIGAKGFRNVFKNHPRQDTEFGLQKLVNKLGDTNKATKGLVLHVLTNIQHDHHDMKLTLISLVQEFLNRPNVSSNGQYACLCLLKDVVLSTYDDCIAERLVKIYFEFFEICSKKGEVDSRFMATILRGLNRAYPYLKDKKLSVLDKQLQALYKICHLVNFNVGTQALQLIYQVQSSSEDVPSDRFYTILYNKLLDSEFGSSSFKSAFLNVVFKAIVRDNNRSRICAFIRRLLQVSKYQSSEMASGVLFLISEVVKDNLVLKRDLLSLLMTGYYNNNEAVNVKPATSVPSDDENEYYSDLDTDGEEADSENVSKEKSSLCCEKNKSEANLKFQSPNTKKSKRKETKLKTEPSWVHKNNWTHSDVKQEIRTTKYDPAIRNPLYCGADLLSIWEVASFKHHFHPTVSFFASQLLDRIFVEYSGDPLEDLTLTRFLNRFVQRNPKEIKAEKNKIGTIFGSRNAYVPKGTRNLDVTSSIFKKLEKDKVAPEDLFLHRYFTEYRKDKDVDRKRKRSESDDEEAEDNLFDKFVTKKMSGFGSLGDEEEDEDYDLDFASKLGGTDRRDSEGDEEDYEMGSENEIDEFNSKSEDLFSGDEDDMDLEDYGSDEMDDISDEEEYSRTSSKKTKDGYGDWSSKLVDADEIAHLFEENDNLAGTSEAVLNKDKSHAKQLNWEHNRFSSHKQMSFKGKEKSKKIHKAKKRKNL